MKVTLTVLGALALAAILAAVGLGTSWFGLVTARPMQKYAEETRSQTYDQSRTYLQGTNKDLMDYCTQYKQAKDADSRAAIKAEINETLATFSGSTNSAVGRCLADIGVSN